MPARHISRIAEDIQSIVEVRDLNTETLTLCLHNNLLISLVPLSAFTNLVDLNVSLNRIQSTSGLQGLSKLTSLNLSSNLLRDCNSLEGLPGLKSLQLQFNHISAISPLCDLNDKATALAYLDLRGNNFSRHLEAESLQKLSGVSRLLVDAARAQVHSSCNTQSRP